MREMFTWAEIMDAVEACAHDEVVLHATAGGWQYAAVKGDRAVWISAETGSVGILSATDWRRVADAYDTYVGPATDDEHEAADAIISDVTENSVQWLDVEVGGTWDDFSQRVEGTVESIVRVLDGTLSEVPFVWETDEDEICGDCLAILANDDDSGMDEAQAIKSRHGLAQMAESYGVEAIISSTDDEGSFDSRGCRSCWSDLAGDRYRVDVVIRRNI